MTGRRRFKVFVLMLLDPNGKKLGCIVHGQRATTNVAFGGEDWKTLFFTSWASLGSVRVKIAGVPVPVKMRT
jgi:sugar lactone lactonase YvrE